MGEEDRWIKLREIVREECERIEKNIIAVLAKNGKQKVELVNGKWQGITDQTLEAWSLAYPAVDIQSELNKAAAWIISNPTMAPRTQFSRFLLTWFSRTQDRSSIRSIPTRNEIVETKRKHCSYCDAVATGNVGGRWACSTHMRDALDGKPVGHMWGVVAKPVAGNE